MKNVLEKIRKTDIAQAYFLTSEENVAYATGFSGDSSQLLITECGSYFFTDSRYTLQAQKEIENSEIITTGAEDRYHKIAQLLHKEKVQLLGIEKDALSANEFEEISKEFAACSYIDVSQKLLLIRSVKTDEEIGYIKKAAKASEEALEELLPYIKPGVSELDIRAELLYRMFKKGMESAFDPIVAAGENSAFPHATPSNYRLANGDMLTVDFGCKYRGYCSDCTRTFGIGNIDVELKKIYDIVKVAQQRAVMHAKVGASTKSVDACARDYIAQQGYGSYFGHGTGHGVGLQIHELPVLNPRVDTKLEKNMVFTVEPGIYVPGLGGVRIEDTLVGGLGVLYQFTKDLIIL